jgi:peptidoglycan hydrolase-like protein with peptidoglycan-binding domain
MSDGTITTDQRPPAPTTNIVTDPPTFVPISGNFPRPVDPPLADGRLTQGEVGPEVQRLQNALNAAGARDAQGNALTADGDFGRRTFEAVQNYQQTHGMPVTGIADAQLLVQLGVVPAQQAPVQPSPTEQSQRVSPNLLPKQQDPTTNTPVLPQQAPPAEQPQHQSLQNQPSTQWPQHQPPIQPSQQQDQASKSPGQSNITEANQPKLLTDATHPKNERFEQVMKAFETLPAGTFKSDEDRATKAAEAAAESLVGERKLDKVESAKVINGTIYLGDKPNIADPAGHLAFLPLAVNKSIEQTSAAVNAVYATQDKSNEVKADQKAQDKVPDPTLTNPMLEPKQKVYMA